MMSNGYAVKGTQGAYMAPAGYPTYQGGYGHGYYMPMQANTMNAAAMPMQANTMNAAAMPIQANSMNTAAMPMQTSPIMGTQAPPLVPSGAVVTQGGSTIVTVPPVEESYVENILRLNRGKMATVYMTYENNREWNAKIFKGIILAAGRDHIILRDPVTDMRYLLLTLNLNYITFDEPINYQYPFQGGTITNDTPMNS